MADPADELTRVYSRIVAIRLNLDNENVPPETCQMFDHLVDRAQVASKRNLQEFKVGDTFLTANKKYHQGDGVRSQIDGLVNYLRSVMTPETVERIGFPMS